MIIASETHLVPHTFATIREMEMECVDLDCVRAAHRASTGLPSVELAGHDIRIARRPRIPFPRVPAPG